MTELLHWFRGIKWITQKPLDEHRVRGRNKKKRAQSFWPTDRPTRKSAWIEGGNQGSQENPSSLNEKKDDTFFFFFWYGVMFPHSFDSSTEN